MKVIFTRAIHNHPSLEIKVDQKTVGFAHELEIPKGFEVEIEKDVKSIKGLKPSNQDIVKKLLASKSILIVDDSPETQDAIKALKAEVAAEQKIRDITAVKPAAPTAPKTEK